ncbi:unnamed protein product [Prunus armeniaca]|uniref:Uncharacterized protein n=1 Tax=Prunus armeniaca TaxID=36596 RepID=A0A6J5X5R6_PRUAR|nr:unnamed protein product [Prunus armeniaca]
MARQRMEFCSSTSRVRVRTWLESGTDADAGPRSRGTLASCPGRSSAVAGVKESVGRCREAETRGRNFRRLSASLKNFAESRTSTQ